MKLADSFLQIFDKAKGCISADTSSSVWVVTETERKAGIKRLNVDMNKAEYIAFDDKLCREKLHLPVNISTHFKDSNCDGIALIRKGDENLMFFCDLKAAVDTKDIKKGFAQNLFSFIKLHMLLSLCNNYNLTEFNIDFIVVCKYFENSAKKADIFSRVQSGQIADKDVFINAILYPLLKNGEICVKLGDFPQIESLDINPCIKNKKVKLRLLMSSNYADDYVNYSI